MSGKKVHLILSEEELKYLVACGFSLLQNISEKSLVTYTGFTKKEIIEFSEKMRKIAEDNEIIW